jgi:hypothetical protein
MSWHLGRLAELSSFMWLIALLISIGCVQASQQLMPAHLLAELPLSNSENLDVFKVLIALVQR